MHCDIGLIQKAFTSAAAWCRHPLDAAPLLPSGQAPSSALSVLQSQLHQQQLARSLGLADAEVLTMILQGSKALQEHSH